MKDFLIKLYDSYVITILVVLGFLPTLISQITSEDYAAGITIGVLLLVYVINQFFIKSTNALNKRMIDLSKETTDRLVQSVANTNKALDMVGRYREYVAIMDKEIVRLGGKSFLKKKEIIH